MTNAPSVPSGKGLTIYPNSIIIPFGCQIGGNPLSNSRENRHLETRDLVAVVGIHLLYLNKLIERKQYGIEPTIRSGRGRGLRRVFSSEDVYGVALVWWLYEAGLRSKTIQFVLNQICSGKRNSKANDAAKFLLGRRTDFLVIRRAPRTSGVRGGDHPDQRVVIVKRSETARIIYGAGTASILFVSVGQLFANLDSAVVNAAHSGRR